jgi:hypothetical protein
MKSIWTGRTYRDELREPSRGTRWPRYEYERHTHEHSRSGKTWRTGEDPSPCEAECSQPVYDNCITISLPTAPVCAGRAGQALVRLFGWEVVAG